MRLHFSYRRSFLLGFALLAVSGCQTTQNSKVSVDYYRISGNSTAALDREIKRKGPKINGGRHAVAVSRIQIMPNITYSGKGQYCHVSKAKVAVNAKVTLPKWTGRSRANKQMGKAWDNIDRYTRLHESIHVAIAFRIAKEIEDEVLELKQDLSCSSVKRQVANIIDQALVKHDEIQKQFDSDEQERFANFANKKSNKKT